MISQNLLCFVNHVVGYMVYRLAIKLQFVSVLKEALYWAENQNSWLRLQTCGESNGYLDEKINCSLKLSPAYNVPNENSYSMLIARDAKLTISPINFDHPPSISRDVKNTSHTSHTGSTSHQ